MTFKLGNQSRLLVGSFHHSGYLTDIGWSGDVDTADTTTLTSTAKSSIPGMQTSKLDLGGLHDNDATATGQDAMLSGRIQAASGDAVTYAPQGFSSGSLVKFLTARETNYAQASKPDGIVTFKVSLMSDGPVYANGVALQDLGAITANGNSSSVNNTASSANGGAGCLHVTAYSGFTNVVFTIQDSADNSSWADIATFATVTAKTAEIKTVAGTVRQYVRALWTVSGSGSVTAQLSFCRK